jgi:hypothetical protein
MPTLSVPAKTAKEGVRVSTNQLTQIQVKLASIELLVGGPYAEHPYGHTALRVTTAKLDRVFDYGRYGRTWGFGNSEGEGILRVWNDFNAYIKEENSLQRVTTGFVYETSEENAQKILEHFDQKIGGKKATSTRPVTSEFVIDTYNALGPNCTTQSVSAIKQIFPEIDREWSRFQQGRGLGIKEKLAVSAKGWPNYIFMPGDLQAMLESPTARKPKKINKYGARP